MAAAACQPLTGSGDQMTCSDDGISDEARAAAARARERAVTMPSVADLADMTAAALADPGRRMSAEEIRQVFRDAAEHAQRVTYLLGVLAGQLGESGGGP